jgi:thiol-disulfide isomerase/thioredoxin
MTRRSLVQLVALAPFAAPAKDPPRAELALKDSAGRKVRLSEYRGKPVVLNFWATWCVPCNAEMPMLVETERAYRARGVVFIGASLDDPKTVRRIPEFLDRYGVAYPIWIGATGDDLDKLGMGNAVPATAFIDPEGHIVARILGQMRPAELRERLDWLTGPRGGPPPVALVKHLSDTR